MWAESLFLNYRGAGPVECLFRELSLGLRAAWRQSVVVRAGSWERMKWALLWNLMDGVTPPGVCRVPALLADWEGFSQTGLVILLKWSPYFTDSGCAWGILCVNWEMKISSRWPSGFTPSEYNSLIFILFIQNGLSRRNFTMCKFLM